ncbi:MAG TPA: hypothetical protein VMG12_35650 [Polyangiaceae bacterium]|nr:hypothetical protein [Polyangiaceae bacterium]
MPELDQTQNPLSRVELLRLAQGLGVVDADVMTRAELRAAIDKAQRPEPPMIDTHPVTWVSVARRLLASVVERGLNLPDAAALIRGDAKLMAPPKAPPPVATVTLARIYAAQGHLDRAIGTLDEVLESDPDHELARDLRHQLDVRRADLAARAGDAAPLSRGEYDVDTAPLPSESSAPEVRDSAVYERAVYERAVYERAAIEGPDVESAAFEPAHEPPPSDDALTPLPPPVASFFPPAEDPPAEFVAPSFDTLENQATFGEPPAFPTEPPTLVGVGPLDLIATDVPADDAETPEPPRRAGESNPPATLAAPIDWQIESDTPRASTETESLPATATDSVTAADSGSVTESATATDSVTAADSDSVTDSESAPLHTNGASPAPLLPLAPGLLLIETDSPIRYIYWELTAASTPHWIHVVTHTPTGGGDTERRERRIPVHRPLGALRIEGVPRQAVVRAKLTHAADDARPLVVAGSVRSVVLGSESFEVRYAPHAKATPEALAGRARPLLERASAIYWDS